MTFQRLPGKMSTGDRLLFLGLAFAGLAVPVMVLCRHFLGLDFLGWVPAGPGRTWVGVVLTVLAVVVLLLNGYLSVLRPWSYRRRHGSMEGYGFVSGMPCVGNVLVGAAGALMPESAALDSLPLEDRWPFLSRPMFAADPDAPAFDCGSSTLAVP